MQPCRQFLLTCPWTMQASLETHHETGDPMKLWSLSLR
jgi:hypothetical protein